MARILCVDNSIDARRILRRGLRDLITEGAVNGVDIVSSREEATALIEKGGVEYAVVTTNLHNYDVFPTFPQGTQPSYVLISGDVTGKAEKKASEDGIPLLRKPFTAPELVEVIKSGLTEYALRQRGFDIM
ncbi:hypothetical protein HYX12_03535 [Candidatus Woesearchaeota archaeon]|nr:hypothetical protein [Candidatus Woesearchaeota archaeon]